MPRVVRVKDTRLGRDYGFLYVLKTAEDLAAYVEKVVKKRMLAGFKDACKAENGSQTATAEGAAILLAAQARKSSLLGATAYLQDQLELGLLRQAESAWQRHGERQGWLLLAAPALHRRRRNQSRQLDFAANQANLDSSKAQGLSSSAQSSRRLIYGDCRRPSTTEGLWPDMAALYS